jgi:hypothetical protein
MNLSFRFGADWDRSLQVLWGIANASSAEAGAKARDSNRNALLAVLPATEHPMPFSLDRLRPHDAQRRLQLPQGHDPMRSIVLLRQD